MFYDYNAEWVPSFGIPHILCIWYVNKTLLSHTIPLFRKDEYNEFVRKLAEVIYVHSEVSYNVTGHPGMGHVLGCLGVGQRIHLDWTPALSINQSG